MSVNEPVIEMETQWLYASLTREETEEAALRAAGAEAARERLRVEKAQTDKMHRERLNEINQQVTDNLKQVQDRRALRCVLCEVITDLAARIITTRRLDTGEIIAERPLTEAEYEKRLQLILPEGGNQ